MTKARGLFLAAAFAFAVLIVLAVRHFVLPAAQIQKGLCARCNVILISIDSLRADHMGAYGYARPTTPSIDAWAAKSILFEQYYSTAYLTPISEGSVHTGLYPEVNGLTGFRRELSPQILTLAEIFKRNGYRTAAMGSSPEFTVWENLRKSFSRGFDVYEMQSRRVKNRRMLPLRDAGEFIGAGKEPFFLWLTIGAVHAPFGMKLPNRFADPKYTGAFRDLIFFANMQYYFDGMVYDFANPSSEIFLITGPRGVHTVTKTFNPATRFPLKTKPADMQFIADQYDNGVAAADRQFGALMSYLRRQDLLKDTVVILQSEHGESLGEHGYIAHYDILQETTHVPLIISSPGLIGGARTDILASGIDILPTLLAHTGLDAGGLGYPVDGIALFTPEGEVGAGRNEIFLTRTPLWESILRTPGGNNFFGRFRDLDDQVGFKDRAIKTRDAKLVHRTSRLVEEEFSSWTYVSGKKIKRPEYELYNLRTDPGELSPLKAEADPRFAELREKLSAFEADMKARGRLTAQSPLLQDYQ